jgi:tetratricopeptide (TPR) repeat protein
MPRNLRYNVTPIGDFFTQKRSLYMHDLTALLKNGLSSLQSGDYLGAEKVFRKVLNAVPGNIHALNLLGMALLHGGHAEEAIVPLLLALDINPKDHQACENLGLAYKEIHKLPQAIDFLRRATTLAPQSTSLNSLGNVLRESGQIGQALQAFDSALAFEPNFAECWSNKAVALNDAGRWALAIKASNRALQLNSNLPQAFCARAESQLSQAKFVEALADFDRALTIAATYLPALLGRGRVLKALEKQSLAVEVFEQAIKHYPKDAQAHYLLALLKEQWGDRPSAVEYYQKAIRRQPDFGQARHQLSQLQGQLCGRAEIEDMQRFLLGDTLSFLNRVHMNFALYRAFEKNQEYTKAWYYLHAGNSLAASKSLYNDRVQRDAMLTLSAAMDNTPKLDLIAQFGSRPVFIVGMPRSGSSLIEQILAGHSQVTAAGELSYGYDLAEQSASLSGVDFPHSLSVLKAEDWQNLANTYRSRFASSGEKSRVIVDKTPMNFQYLGMLAQALPDAKFVHCTRDPISNCFSIYRLPFATSQTYAHSLLSLGQYYRHYQHLMERWQSLFPGRILDVAYENTVTDIEGQTEGLLSFLELPFEPEMLKFHETQRLVRTPSADQVRQKLYTHALEAWRPYESELDELRTGLAL